MKFTIFGLTLSSSWGNGHATPYRSLIRALGFPSQVEPDRDTERRKEILRELAEGRIKPDDAAALLEGEPT